MFSSAPDFETPLDNGTDNFYNLTVQASDGALTATQDITVTITDVNEGTPNSAPSGLSSAGKFGDTGKTGEDCSGNLSGTGFGWR